MSTCVHLNFQANCQIIRLKGNEEAPDTEPVKMYTMNVRVQCAECGKRFVFVGLEAGANLAEPMVSIDGQEGRFPIGPEGEVVTEMEGTPLGFTIRRTA